MLIALAGRRVDAPNTDNPRFPAGELERVRREIRAFLESSGARALVCAAACGADILALEEAGALGLRRRIVLPYSTESFRKSSVADRPGDWGDRYDRIVAEVSAAGDLVAFDHPADRDETYFQTNHDILDEARKLADEMGSPLGALVAWNGQSRGDSDVTGHFLAEARKRDLPVAEILTVQRQG